MKILMVCLGNICRSPLAEAIMEQKIKRAGLDWTVDSAGTGSYHTGEPPDPRAINVAKKFGVDISNQRARQIKPKDLDEFDLVLTMDNQVFQDVMRMGRSEDEKLKIKLIMQFPYPDERMEVPDPYFDNNFSRVFQMLDEACDAVLKKGADPEKAK